jgi:hypothetical protein
MEATDSILAAGNTYEDFDLIQRGKYQDKST